MLGNVSYAESGTIEDDSGKERGVERHHLLVQGNCVWGLGSRNYEFSPLWFANLFSVFLNWLTIERLEIWT